jgi:proteasome lid subunit RPN8/RPN11
MLTIPSVASPASLALAHEVGLNSSHPKALAAWRLYALEKVPNEAAGFFLTGDRFMPVENVSDTPDRHFTFNSALYTDVADEIEGIVHSHTPGPEKDQRGELLRPDNAPTKLDMECQISSDVPWGISIADDTTVSDPLWWGDSLPIRPLLGRVFMHGINDCYSLLRDWHRLHGVHFEDVPRDTGWWKNVSDAGEAEFDLYIDLFESRGFKRVRRDAPRKGDCFIAHLHSPLVRNHAGVFIDDEQFIHHAGGQLSLRQFGHVWNPKLDFLVRHESLPEVMP